MHRWKRSIADTSTVGKEALLTHLQKVCNIVSRRPVLPILNNVRLETRDNILNLKATVSR